MVGGDSGRQQLGRMVWLQLKMTSMETKKRASSSIPVSLPKLQSLTRKKQDRTPDLSKKLSRLIVMGA
jgi:hypothetical protein